MERKRWKAIHRISIALYSYCIDNGELPYHTDGAAKALYLLKPYISAEAFRLPGGVPREKQMPYWNDRTKELQGGDYLYPTLFSPVATR